MSSISRIVHNQVIDMLLEKLPELVAEEEEAEGGGAFAEVLVTTRTFFCHHIFITSSFNGFATFVLFILDFLISTRFPPFFLDYFRQVFVSWVTFFVPRWLSRPTIMSLLTRVWESREVASRFVSSAALVLAFQFR